jgi:hypothetical protein
LVVSCEADIAALNKRTIWSLKRGMLPHRPPVGIKPCSAMKCDSDGPSSSSRLFVLTASVVNQVNTRRG